MDRSQVPDPPAGLVPHVDHHGHEVYDHLLRRWRYRDGQLVAFVEYRTDARRLIVAGRNPWRRAWCKGDGL